MTARQRNLKALIAQWGGGEALAKKLGYSGSSYLSQMVTGHRPISEKTARSIEKELGLHVGWLDREHHKEDAPVISAVHVDTSLFAKVAVTVAQAMGELGVHLPREQFDEVIALVYDEAIKTGDVNTGFVHRVLRLLR